MNGWIKDLGRGTFWLHLEACIKEKLSEIN